MCFQHGSHSVILLDYNSDYAISLLKTFHFILSQSQNLFKKHTPYTLPTHLHPSFIFSGASFTQPTPTTQASLLSFPASGTLHWQSTLPVMLFPNSLQVSGQILPYHRRAFLTCLKAAHSPLPNSLFPLPLFFSIELIITNRICLFTFCCLSQGCQEFCYVYVIL